MFDSEETVTCRVNGVLTTRPLDYVELEMGRPDKRYPKLYPGEEVVWVVGSRMPLVVSMKNA